MRLISFALAAAAAYRSRREPLARPCAAASSRPSMTWRRIAPPPTTRVALSCASRRQSRARWSRSSTRRTSRRPRTSRSRASCAAPSPTSSSWSSTLRASRTSTSTRATAVPFGTSEASPAALGRRRRRPRAAAGDGWCGGPRAPRRAPAARGARGALTSQYRAFGRAHGAGCARAASSPRRSRPEQLGARCVLADRDSVETIERVLELLLRSGDPLGALGGLQKLSDGELEPLKQRALARRGRRPRRGRRRRRRRA